RCRIGKQNTNRHVLPESGTSSIPNSLPGAFSHPTTEAIWNGIQAVAIGRMLIVSGIIGPQSTGISQLLQCRAQLRVIIRSQAWSQLSMRFKSRWLRPFSFLAIIFVTFLTVSAQQRTPPDPELVKKREATERQLESIAIIERKLMVPMRDGKRMAADVYRPKDTSKKYATVFVRTPYNFNFWDVRNGLPRDLSSELDAVKRGYAFVEMNERGHFFSEGNYDILGPPLTDGDDAISWIAGQPWSNGKVGLIGCSSTAEWQLAVAAQGNPALAAIIPQGFGAGVGRVAPYFEQGNWYRGGAVQMLFIAWIYGEQNQVRPMFPPDTSQEDLIRASKSFDLSQQLPPVDWSQALRHLPEKDIIDAVGGPHGIFADHMPVDTGGAMIERAPNDPA